MTDGDPLGPLGRQSGGRGGLGGTASGPINVFGGETLYIEVAGNGLPNNTGGWNGGANRAIGMWGNRAGTGGGGSGTSAAAVEATRSAQTTPPRAAGVAAAAPTPPAA
ncbi:MAG TPA: hypothetical protein VK680_13765 [Solirubrobacteraceae bacterium]|nr:hypothetical protein [Solirubrobacteraceae bacterium]